MNWCTRQSLDRNSILTAERRRHPVLCIMCSHTHHRCSQLAIRTHTHAHGERVVAVRIGCGVRACLCVRIDNVLLLCIPFARAHTFLCSVCLHFGVVHAQRAASRSVAVDMCNKKYKIKHNTIDTVELRVCVFVCLCEVKLCCSSLDGCVTALFLSSSSLVCLSVPMQVWCDSGTSARTHSMEC